MKTAVIYARYSSNNQTEQSIEGQVHVCQDFAKRNDIIIVDSYIDRAISGTTDEREAFQRMLKDSNNKKWDYVLVYKLDRFARNKYESAIHRKHLKDNGIKLLSAMENIPETPEGVLLESLLEGMNQYFSEELAQKVSRGLHESRMKGHCIGSVPYRLNGKVYDKIYPPIISQELFQNVKKRLDANRYGCRKDNHEIFRLKDKIYCGCCDRKMYPVSAISSNGQTIRYYKCITTKKRNCLVGIIDKTFIESVIDKFLISQFNIPENLEELSTKIYELHKKRVGNNNSLNALKNELQRTNTAISNIMIAIEKGILTDTTRSRLEELEKQKKDLQEKLVIEQSKERYELTKEDIQNFFKYTMKKCPDRAIELFIKQIKVYDDKIEIYLNYSINQPHTTKQTSKKLFTETHTTQRIFKGGTIRTFTKTYDVYVVL